MSLQETRRETVKERLARLEAENERLNAAIRKKSSSNLRLALGNKRNISLYGLQKWPVTFYRDQWEKILDMADEIREFIKNNQDKLA